MDNNTIGNIATETPKGYGFRPILQGISEIFVVPTEIIRVLFAVALSSLLHINPPLWLLLVGVPSSAKTELLSLFRGLDFIYFLDSMTLNPFASGYKGTGGAKTHDLLPLLNDKCFIVKDYTTIFSMNEETTKKLLGELVAIYDGCFEKFSPTRGHVKYESLFSHIGAVTPAALNQHARYLNIVGPRFMLYKLPALSDDRRKEGFEIAWKKTNRKQKINELKTRIATFYKDIEKSNPEIFEVTDIETQEKLQNLSLLMARSRGAVMMQQNTFKNDENKEVTYYDVTDLQIEEPWRALLQLRALGTCLAILEGRDSISADDVKILTHIVTSSMPSDRSEALQYAITHKDITAKDLSEAVDKSVRTCQRLLKELSALGIIEAYFGDDLKSKHYILHKDFSFLMASDSGVPSGYVMTSVPDRPIASWGDEDLEGIRVYLRDALINHDAHPEEIPKCKEKIEEIESEMKRRGCYPDGEMSVADQLLIEETIPKQPQVRM